jgi:transcriptional regulator with PAS, ATPase and Fis domain
MVSERARVATEHVVLGSRVMRDLLERCRRFARSPATILIIGETGVGKELVASLIHASSDRAHQPFVTVNCAGLPETLLESELFGHVKGSFTGAYRDKAGKFELAHKGTLFLDEVGEMTLRMQGLVLRALDGGEIQKVGADYPTSRVDCRIISATNRPLMDMARLGTFREDLFYRLNVISVRVPPLRERLDDIPPLAEYFLRKYTSSEHRQFTPDAIAALQSFPWPGNVRQLQNVVQRLAITGGDGPITAADLPSDIPRQIPVVAAAPRERRRAVADVLYERLTEGMTFWTAVYTPYVEHEITRGDLRSLIERGLKQCGGNYRLLTGLFNMPLSDYRRFLNFLRKEKCLLPFRSFR